MKVLFAVSNEEISESVVKRYQREYKEIISYKNVYYFNAILKELQKDKNYDRIVISEELEAFTHTQYDQIDKFIFDKLDSISDEASNLRGEDIPIILISSDRRDKSEEMLVKLFGIGIYSALIGNDRSVNNVCKLINKPRSKKEAKLYYKIDSDDVSYESVNENDVSEVEIQNIIAHYKRLGKDEKKYVESFNNIASQYNDIQLKIIIKFLPLNVRAVLEEKSSKYQELIAFNSRVSNNLRDSKKTETQEGTSSKLLRLNNNERILTKPVVIPSSVNMNGAKKMAKVKKEVEPIEEIDEINNLLNENVQIEENIINEKQSTENEFMDLQIEEQIQQLEQMEEQKPKRGRGRPRKNPIVEETTEVKPKRGRGRPRKNPVVEEIEETSEEMVLPGFDEIKEEEVKEETILPGFDEIEDKEETILPGFFDESEDNINEIQVMDENLEIEDDEIEESILPGFDEEIEPEETIVPGISTQVQQEISSEPKYETFNNDYESKAIMNETLYEDIDISNLLSADKKVACFIGTSKNGTSFVINNLAQVASSKGINVAILDTTKNRNSYYIYTKNEEELRKTAMNCIDNLLQGNAEGIIVNKNLTVYTSLPEETEGIENAGKILETLLKKHSLILIDCDFETPIKYFEKAQEVYLVQTYDVLTIQPLTAFLRELKAKNILKENKLRAVLNKSVKIRGVNDKTIIGGMSCYNDPSMSFMTELFDKNTIRYISIPYDETVYTKYLEGIINCEISLKGYPKNIMQILNELSGMVYPLVSGKSAYVPPRVESNGFTPSMNSTLDRMKKNY